MNGRVNGAKHAIDENRPPTRADYDRATPRGKGWLSYTYSSWPGSQIPDRCPYAVGSKERDQWNEGQQAAMLAAQDSEE